MKPSFREPRRSCTRSAFPVSQVVSRRKQKASTADAHSPFKPSHLQSERAQLQRALDNVDGAVQPDAVHLSREPRYDPVEAAARFRSKPGMVIWRQMQLLGPILRFILQVMFEKQAGNEPKNRRQRAAELREIISNLGPAMCARDDSISFPPATTLGQLHLHYCCTSPIPHACAALKPARRSLRDQTCCQQSTCSRCPSCRTVSRPSRLRLPSACWRRSWEGRCLSAMHS